MITGETSYFIILGAIFGFTAGISPGPLLTLVITETITHNKIEGIKIAIAPLITDLPIITATFFLLSRFSHLNILLSLISFSGGIYLIYLGYKCLRTKGLEIDIQKSGPGSLIKGIVVNILNPHPYLFWITVGTPIALKAYQISPGTAILYFVSFYFLFTGSKISVAIMVERAKIFLTDKIYIWTMRVLGFTLCIFASLFFADFIKNLKNVFN
jgi:threonine/homoserine/homoserine lactone efflux protein